MKQISNEEMKKLIDNNYVRNTGDGFVDKDGYIVGYYRTRHRRYIEDKYVEIAKKMP